MRETRESPRGRGYDAAWDRLSLAYRKANPFCEECPRLGRDALADLVDHIVPLRPPFNGPRLDRANLQSLCRHCHGRKAVIEAHAEETGQLSMISVWVREPETRPAHLRPPKIR